MLRFFQPKPQATLNVALVAATLVAAISQSGCDAPSASRLGLSRQARYLLGPPEPIPPLLLTRQQQRGFANQPEVARHLAGQGWRWLVAAPQTLADGSRIYPWQLWYDRQDLLNLLDHLLPLQLANPQLGLSEFQEAEAWLAQSLVKDGYWQAAQFAAWRQSQEGNFAGTSGLARTLYNPTAALAIIRHWQQIALCSQDRRRHQQACAAVHLPPGAVVLKTHWSRDSQGQRPRAFATADATLLATITDGVTWQPAAADPSADFWQHLITQVSPSGARFRLTGLHAARHTDSGWLWSSLWAAASGASSLTCQASDCPPAYQYCAVAGFTFAEPLAAAHAAHAAHAAQAAQAAQADAEPQPKAAAAWYRRLYRKRGPDSWCANPYLESEPNNHRGNCVGCHQYAGYPNSLGTIAGALADHPEAVIHNQKQPPRASGFFGFADTPAALGKAFASRLPQAGVGPTPVTGFAMRQDQQDAP